LRGVQEFGERCLDCPRLENNHALLAQYVELELEAQNKGYLVDEGSVTCKGVQRFIREEKDKFGVCRFTVRAPSVVDDYVRDRFAELGSTHHRSVFYE
jgi:hypothetical protein